jgi:hypothetical protein
MYCKTKLCGGGAARNQIHPPFSWKPGPKYGPGNADCRFYSHWLNNSSQVVDRFDIWFLDSQPPIGLSISSLFVCDPDPSAIGLLGASNLGCFIPSVWETPGNNGPSLTSMAWLTKSWCSLTFCFIFLHLDQQDFESSAMMMNKMRTGRWIQIRLQYT